MGEHDGHRQRLRSSFLQRGIEGMADHQVLELLLTYALPRVDVNPLAHRLMDRFGSLEEVLLSKPEQLQQVEGVGPSVAAYLSLLGQVDRRVMLQSYSAKKSRVPVLDKPMSLCGYMLALSLSDRYETLRLVCLNRKYGLISESVISTGSLTELLADPRSILEAALARKACYIALSHNHPSGDVTPSREDEEAARRIEQAARNLGIEVLDQLIVGRGAVYSLRTEQVMLFSGPNVAQAVSLPEYVSTMRGQRGAF